MRQKPQIHQAQPVFIMDQDDRDSVRVVVSSLFVSQCSIA